MIIRHKSLYQIFISSIQTEIKNPPIQWRSVMTRVQCRGVYKTLHFQPLDFHIKCHFFFTIYAVFLHAKTVSLDWIDWLQTWRIGKRDCEVVCHQDRPFGLQLYLHCFAENLVENYTS